MSTTPSAPTVSRDPLWGRAYKLSVLTGKGENIVLSQSGWEPEALRVVFEVEECVLPSKYWFATITVYNVDKPDLQNLLWQAQWVTLEAGYQTGTNKSSIIWDGPVLQAMYDRPHIVDTVIIFNCVVGPQLLTENFQNIAHGPNVTQYQAVSQMIGTQGGVIGNQLSKYAQQTLQSKSLPRGKTMWGSATKYMNNISNDNFMTHWIAKDGNDYMSELLDPAVSHTPQIVYGPPYPPGYATSSGPSTAANITRSIVGVPRASQWGVTMEVLLDPRLHVGVPPMLIQLEQQTLVAQMKQQIGDVLKNPLSLSGLFVIGQVTHRGDTRGNEWYTSVQAYTPTYCKGLLTGVWNAIEKGVTGPGATK